MNLLSHSVLLAAEGTEIPVVAPDTGAGGVFDLLWLVIALPLLGAVLLLGIAPFLPASLKATVDKHGHLVGTATAVGRGQGLDPVGAALAQAPAVWLVLALGLLLLSVRSRWAVAGWALVAACVTLGQVGESLDLPGWVVGLSPYHHVPRYPVESVVWRPELVLTALALAVLGASWWRYRGRDIG